MLQQKKVDRKKIDTPPENSFGDIYKYLYDRKGHKPALLHTTGNPGVQFIVEARLKRNDGKPCLVSVSKNKSGSAVYITAEDWGYKVNVYGTRIAHYLKPIDKWFSGVRRSG